MKIPTSIAYLAYDKGDLMRYWAAQGVEVFPTHGVLRLPEGDPRREAWSGPVACTCGDPETCSGIGKHPRTKNGVKDATLDGAKIDAWQAQYGDGMNIGGALGGLLVLDFDPRSGGVLGPEHAAWGRTRWHRSGRGDGGGHLVYRLPAELQVAGLKLSGAGRLGPGVDVKTGPGAYVILPGSQHAEGGQYESDHEGIQEPTEQLIELLLGVAGGTGGKSATGGGKGLRLVAESGEGQVKSLLSSLLANPPKTNWNNWLTSVAGHYARTYRKQRDLYDVHLAAAARELNRGAEKPISEAAIRKVADSVWRTEQTGHPERELQDLARAEAGWLWSSGDGRIMCLEQVGPKDAPEPMPAEWADFDIQVRGVILNKEDQTRLFDALLIRARDGQQVEVVLDSRTLGDARKVTVWLAGYAVSVAQPERVVHRHPGWLAKLIRYIDAQPAPVVELAEYLGWHEGAEAFVTHQGVIRAGSVEKEPWPGVRPDPRMLQQGNARYDYGFEGSAAEARAILQEVCTFHDPEVVAVFGAWWAASLLKHLVLRKTSLFPVMAIEAASGSGKTNGFFAQMIGLSGATRGEGHYTVASLRNALSANRNGVIWVDDLDEPQRIHELIRVLTSGGELSKLGEDRMTTVNYNLVGSLVLSGEALALDNQKALLDRVVMLQPKSPIGRLSQKPGRTGQAQWADVMDLVERVGPGGFASRAGWVVAEALRWSAEFDKRLDLLRAETSRTGRRADREVAILAGAALLDAMVTGAFPAPGQGQHTQALRGWLEASDWGVADSDNTLTLELLPWSLRAFGVPDNPRGMGGGKAAWVDEDGVVWFSPIRLAEVWQDHRHGQINTRTETEGSIRQQARALGLGGEDHGRRKQMRTSKDGTGNKQWYWRLGHEMSLRVIERASGDV